MKQMNFLLFYMGSIVLHLILPSSHLLCRIQKSTCLMYINDAPISHHPGQQRSEEGWRGDSGGGVIRLDSVGFQS